MNTREVVKILSERTGRPQSATRIMYNHVLTAFRKQLTAHDKFSVPGLGTFGVQERSHRKGYNPQLKKMVLLPRKIVAFFKPARALKEMVNREQGHEQ